ncbi:MAG: thioesterase family protein [Ruminococcus sp.]|nr:thioesterase family protein [Ruminococcus sp.]
MKTFNIGAKGSAELFVDDSSLAVNVGSGSLEVLATPTMTMLMEKAACGCIAPYLEGDETTVGTELSIKHISPTPAGMNVTAEAEVTEINGRGIVFKVSAYDDSGLIGSGVHKRFVVFGNRFMAKAAAKLNK